MDFLHFLNLLFGKILITDMLDIIISQVNSIQQGKERIRQEIIKVTGSFSNITKLRQ